MDTINLLLLATLITKLVDLIKDKACPPEWSQSKMLWIWTAVTLAVGVGISFAFHADIFAALGYEGEYVWWVARILTGLALGGGAAFLYDIIDKD